MLSALKLQSGNSTKFLFSPLDQFDDLNFSLFNRVLENSSLYMASTFELEYDAISIWSLNNSYNSIFGVESTFIAILFIFTILHYSQQLFSNVSFLNTMFGEFSIFSLFIFMQILTISGLFLWFTDFYQIFLISSGDLELSIIPQINFSLIFDENFITFIAGFLLIGGAEEEEDENFILEEEDSDYAEDIVAPVYLSSLGKDVEDNAALYLKLNTVFSFVLFNNLIGMLPYSDTATSSLMLTFWVALSVFGSLIYLLLRKHGVAYFFALFMPSGSPLALAFLLIPIEFISYIFRVVSLSVRLFANMFAGHTLLKVIVGFSWSMVLIGDVFLIVNIFPMAILFVLTFLEIGVAIVQSYIFVTLTALYLKDLFVAH